MSLQAERKAGRARALRDFQNPDEPWSASVVREHLAHFRRQADRKKPVSDGKRLAAHLAETDAYCEEFTRLWTIRKANAAKRHAA